MTDRIPLDHLTDDQLNALYDQLDALRAVSRGYCSACGRGDAAPTIADWEHQRQRAEQAEQARAEAEQRNADNWSRAEAAEARAERAEADRDRLAAELRAAEQRIEQHRRALADALAVHATAPWPQLIAHARAYVRHTDEWHALAVRRREHAERAEAALERVRVAVNALCHEPHPSHDHVCPDHIAAVVQAALNAEQVDPAEPAPAPIEPATPLPAPPPIPTPDAPDVDRSHNGAGPDGETPLVPAHDASLKQAAATETTLDQR